MSWGDMPRVFVTPHSTEPAQLEALDATLRALHMGGPLARDASGNIAVTPTGDVYADVTDGGFVALAVKHQGYARDAVSTGEGPTRELVESITNRARMPLAAGGALREEELKSLIFAVCRASSIVAACWVLPMSRPELSLSPRVVLQAARHELPFMVSEGDSLVLADHLGRAVAPQIEAVVSEAAKRLGCEPSKRLILGVQCVARLEVEERSGRTLRGVLTLLLATAALPVTQHTSAGRMYQRVR